MVDVAVIGCGIVGAAAAYALSKRAGTVLVLEKENDVSDGATKANSAILHAGYDPKPGTLMARLNVEGSRLAKELCQKLDVPYRQCGSLVLAFTREDVPTLEKLKAQGEANGVPGMRMLAGDEARRLEPNISGDVVAALEAPSAAIVSPWEYCFALAETAARNGADIRLGHRVTGLRQLDGGWEITTDRGVFAARYVLNAAGAYADEVHNMAAAPAFRIIPARGEYYLLDKTEGARVGRVVFQCPGRTGKGVLVAPTVHGNLIVGPNNHYVKDPADVANTREGLALVAALAKKSVPSVELRQNIRNFAGIRAATDVDDFIIAEAAPHFIDLAGIKSPGLTAAPAIAQQALRLLEACGLALPVKKDVVDTRRRVRFAHATAEEKAALVRENPAFGRVVCRCETVTEGEILAALASPLPPHSLDAVKRRCSPGMGRCQGGFCAPRVLEILSRELGVPQEAVTQDKTGAYILAGRTKGGC